MDWDWLSENGWAVWLGLALALGAIEAATADFIFLMLAGGAVAGLVAGVFTESIAIQLIAASVTALVLLVTVRPVLKRHMLDRLPGTGMGIETYAGKGAVVTAAVDENDGRVEVDHEEWSARTDRPTIPLPPGTDVTIVRVDGATLVVEPTPGIQDSVAGEDRP